MFGNTNTAEKPMQIQGMLGEPKLPYKVGMNGIMESGKPRTYDQH